MGKSLGNFITLTDFFSGDHDLLEQAYQPMVIRFFMLQAQYRNTLDFSNDALKAADKGLQRLLKGIETLKGLQSSDTSDVAVLPLQMKCYEALNDDLNSPILIAHLYEGVKMINNIASGKSTITNEDLNTLQQIFQTFAFDILGLQEESGTSSNTDLLDDVVNILLQTRVEAKANKNFTLSDKIRDELTALGFVIKDKKDGFEWEYNN